MSALTTEPTEKSGGGFVLVPGMITVDFLGVLGGSNLLEV